MDDTLSSPEQPNPLKGIVRLTTLPACPHCGALDHVYVAGRPVGMMFVWFSFRDGLLKEVEADANGITYLRVGPVECGICSKERDDLRYVPASGVHPEHIEIVPEAERRVRPTGMRPIDRATGLVQSDWDAREYVPSDSRPVLALFDNGASMVLDWCSDQERWIGPVENIGTVVAWQELIWDRPCDLR